MRLRSTDSFGRGIAIAKKNYVDHTVNDFTSIIRFIEANWNLGQIGNGSFDAIGGSLNSMFNFSNPGSGSPQLFLDPNTGQPS